MFATPSTEGPCKRFEEAWFKNIEAGLAEDCYKGVDPIEPCTYRMERCFSNLMRIYREEVQAYETAMRYYNEERTKFVDSQAQLGLVTAELDSLRQTITTLNKALTITSECNFKLREQLAECEREKEALRNGLAIAQNSDEHNFQRWQRDAEQLAEITKERDNLHQVCRDAYEVWAGSEGFPQPTTASEAYVLQQLCLMRDEVKRGLAKVGAGKTGDGS